MFSGWHFFPDSVFSITWHLPMKLFPNEVSEQANWKIYYSLKNLLPPVSNHPKCQAYSRWSLMEGGLLWELILGHKVASLGIGKDLPHILIFYICENWSSRKKKQILPIQKFPFLVPLRNTLMLLQKNSCLWEAKNKRKFQTFSFKSGFGGLIGVVDYKRFQIP